MALLELLAAAAGTRVVAADVLHRIAHRRLRFVVMMLAVRAMNVTRGTLIMNVAVVVAMVVAVVVIVLAVRAVDVGLSHSAIP